jgi:hypothetical protein
MSAVIVDPRGRPVVSAKREIRIRNERIAKFAAFADDVFRQLHLTVVCVACGETPQMNNAATDSLWRMECGCTVRVLTNPDVQSAVTRARH